jgi:hypothetical protein
MVSRNEHTLRSALSTLAVALWVVAGAGSTVVLAQTGTLQAPASSLKTAPRPGQTIGNTPVSTLSAPAIGIVRPAVPVAGVQKYVLKAQVVPGTSLSATQKVALASAALADMLKQAMEQQDNVKQQTLSQSQNNVSVAAGPTLSLQGPKSPTWNAFLILNNPTLVNFQAEGVGFSKGGVATCFFTAPEDGFYMALFTVANQSGQAITLTAGIGISSTWVVDNEAAVTVNPGANVVTIVQQTLKGNGMRATLSGNGAFDFKSCEISRIK